MKHAGPATLAALEALLNELRGITALKERTPGAFYRKGQAWLHFHEDPAGIFADIRLDASGFTRLAVNTAQEQAHLLLLARQACT
jgi:hypothetical protein